MYQYCIKIKLKNVISRGKAPQSSVVSIDILLLIRRTKHLLKIKRFDSI